MTKEQVEELSGLTQANFLESIDIIKQTILDVIEMHGDHQENDSETSEEIIDVQNISEEPSPSVSFDEEVRPSITIDISESS